MPANALPTPVNRKAARRAPCLLLRGRLLLEPRRESRRQASGRRRARSVHESGSWDQKRAGRIVSCNIPSQTIVAPDRRRSTSTFDLAPLASTGEAHRKLPAVHRISLISLICVAKGCACACVCLLRVCPAAPRRVPRLDSRPR